MHESLLQYLHQMLDHPLSEDEIGLIRETFVLKKSENISYFLKKALCANLQGL
jgi:hypothetical protein